MIKIIKIITEDDLLDFESLDSKYQMEIIDDWRMDAIDFIDNPKFELLVFSDKYLDNFKDKEGKLLFKDKYELTHDNGR